MAHIDVDVRSIACDFYVFSGHKMYAPNGIGVCWGKFTLLEQLAATKLGGEMVQSVSFDSFTTQAPPLKFEAGTPNVAGALGLHQAAAFVQQHLNAIVSQEDALFKYLVEQLQSFQNIRLLGNMGISSDMERPSIGIVSFYVPNFDNHSIALMLYEQGIALRFGQHCAMPLLASLGISACLRVSLACYNNKNDIDLFIHALRTALSQSEQQASNKPSTLSSELSAQHTTTANVGNCASLFVKQESDIKNARNWPEKHRQLLLLSKHLPTLALEARTQSAEIIGCEAKVWLQRNEVSGELLGYSDSKVVRGIMALLLLKHKQLKLLELSDAGHIQIRSKFDYSAYLTDLGLSDYFSSGRKDGVQMIIKRLNT